MPGVRKIAHLGIAVREIEPALVFYRDRLGLSHTGTQEMPERGLKIAFCQAGDVLVELLAPLHEGSEISKFIETRGEGIHHLCFEVEDIRSELARLGSEGVRLINSEPKTGAEGLPVAFLHPKSCFGTLVELLESPKS